MKKSHNRRPEHSRFMKTYHRKNPKLRLSLNRAREIKWSRKSAHDEQSRRMKKVHRIDPSQSDGLRKCNSTKAGRKRVSKMMIERYKDPKEREAQRRRFLGIRPSRKCLVASAKSMASRRKKKPSCIERMVVKVLRGLKIKYRREVRIGINIIDFYLIEHGIWLEADSNFYHGRLKKRRDDKKRDKRIFRDFGIKIYRLCETTIRDTFKLFDSILRIVLRKSNRRSECLNRIKK